MRHPLLFQINTRVLLTERSRELGRSATLDDLPDNLFDRIGARGFSWLWLLGVWQTGEAARRISRSNAELRAGYENTLTDLQERDITGSPFAVQRYTTHASFGGDSALERVRRRLSERGLRLVLDYVVNHMAPDSPWAIDHPELFVHGSEDDLEREPQNYTRVRTSRGERILAYGRDPYFAGWADTLQLNHRHPACREAMIGELMKIANAPTRSQCYAPLEVPALAGRRVVLVDLMSDVRYERIGDELNAGGLYLDLPPWGYHVFDLATS